MTEFSIKAALTQRRMAANAGGPSSQTRDTTVCGRTGIWAPGVRLFGSLNFRWKAALISAAFGIPIAFLAWQFFVDGKRERDTATLEIQGVDALRRTDALLATLREQRHAVLSGQVGKPDAAAFDAGLASVRSAAATLHLEAKTKVVAEAHATLRNMPSPVGEPPIQTYIDAVASLANDMQDASALSLDPDVPTYYLQSIVYDVVPQAVEALSHAEALATQYEAKASAPEGRAAHQLFALTDWATRHLTDIESVLERVRAADPESASRVQVKGPLEKVRAFAGGADRAWFGDKFVGTPAGGRAASIAAMKAMQEIRDQARAALVEGLNARVSRIDRNRSWVAALLVGALSLTAYMFYCFSLVISGGMDEVQRHLVAMTDGDLTTSPRPRGHDETAALMRALAKMQESLRSIVSRVRDSSESIVEDSAAVASASVDLSTRTEQAASDLERSASAMEQVASTVKLSADHSREAALVAADNSQVAQRGGAVIGQVVATMDEIQTSSRKISEIIGTIDGIAFQTNILALNAAVEAARAGEQGRGFAVVASEVRSLAQRSAAAAREIKTLIEQSVDKVHTGTQVVRGAGDTMTELVAKARRINDLLSEISSASSEQSKGVAQVSRSVKDLDAATHDNHSLVEQTAAASESLKVKALDLASEVARFRLPAAV